MRQVEEALATGRSVVVDNTNARKADRAPLVEAGRRFGARLIAVHFTAAVAEALRRNAGREGRARVPDVAIFTTARRMEAPAREEGFDELLRVRVDGDAYPLESIGAPPG